MCARARAEENSPAGADAGTGAGGRVHERPIHAASTTAASAASARRTEDLGMACAELASAARPLHASCVTVTTIPAPAETAGPRWLYLHGFASGPSSFKGTTIAARYEARGVAMERLNLRVPSF